MALLPVLETERLILKPFILEDAPAVTVLANDYELYKSTLHLPYPYDITCAVDWIQHHELHYSENGFVTLGAFLKGEEELIGAFSLGQVKSSNQGEVGYWVGRKYWGKGYASEATQALIAYGFGHLNLNRIYGRYLTMNPASQKVMEKNGMTFEGVLKEAVFKDGTYHDVGYMALLRNQWLKNSSISQLQLTMRRATLKDASALLYIEQKAFSDDIERYGERSDCPAYETLERLEQKITTFDYYAVEENQRIIGGAVVRPLSDDEIRVSRIYIDPAYHNLGVGKFLMIQLETLYPQMRVWGLDTPYKNYRNHHFYELLGYEKVGETVLDDTLTLFEYRKEKESL